MYVVLALGLAVCRYTLAAPLMAFAGASVTAILAAIGILPSLPEAYWPQFSTLFLAGSAVAAAQILMGLPFAIGGLALFALLFVGIGQPFLAWQLVLTVIVITAGCQATEVGFGRHSTFRMVFISMRFPFSNSARC